MQVSFWFALMYHENKISSNQEHSFPGRQNKGPKQMMQRSIVAAPMPAAAFRRAASYFPPLAFVSLPSGELTEARHLLRVSRSKNVIRRDRKELTHRRLGAGGTGGVSMAGGLPKLAGRFLERVV